MTTLELLQLVDLGDFHCRSAEEMFEVGLYRECQELVRNGYLKQLGPRGRFPERFVVTTLGSQALGTESGEDAPKTVREPAARVQSTPVLCLASL